MTVPNGCSPSTTTRWAYVKIERAAGPGSRERQAGGAGRSTSGLSGAEPTDWRRRQTIQVKYRGGPECWWELSRCGRTVRVAGHDAIYDAMRWLFGDGGEGRGAG